MEVKVLQITDAHVALVFVPRTREDLQMAQEIFTSVVANHFCLDLMADEPTPEDEERMYSSKEVQFIYNHQDRELKQLIIKEG